MLRFTLTALENDLVLVKVYQRNGRVVACTYAPDDNGPVTEEKARRDYRASNSRRYFRPYNEVSGSYCG